MKKILVILLFSLLISISIKAQTTYNVFLEWGPNSPTENVSSYGYSLDNGIVTSVDPVTIDTTCICYVIPLTVSQGIHTFAVTATNDWGTSLPTIVTANINKAGNVVNVKVKGKR